GAQTANAGGDGRVVLSNVPLALGANKIDVLLTDLAGNTATTSLTLTRTAVAPVDTQAPTLSNLRLATDSGSSSTDGLSNVVTVQAQGADNVKVVKLLVALDPAAGAPTFTDLSSASLAADGRIQITRAQLDTLAGGTLAQGAHTLVMRVEDAVGLSSPTASLSFNLDSVAPVLSATLAQDTGSRTDDGVTSKADIRIVASDASGALSFEATVDGGNFEAITPVAQADGSWLWSGASALADGAHAVQLRAHDGAGNVSAVSTVSFTLLRAAPSASLSLDAAFDTGAKGDLETSASPVSIVVQTQAGVLVSLGAQTATAGGDGRVVLSNVPLALGANKVDVLLTDVAGNTATASLTLTRVAVTGVDTQAPTLSNLRLATDSGSSSTDGLSNVVTLQAQGADNVKVVKLLVALDPATGTPTFTDLSSASLAADGSIQITRAQLDVLAGGTLAQGTHTLVMRVEDAVGLSSPTASLSFTLDSVAPTGASFGLATADAVNGQDDQAAAAVVSLRGTAEAGSQVSLGSNNVLVGANGSFTLTGVNLALGANALSLVITDAAGNTQTVTRSITRVAQTQTDAVLTWTQTALKAIQRDVTDPPIATRILAIESLAVYDTLAAIEGSPAYMVQRSVTGAVSADAAVAQAAYRVLYNLFPGQRTQLDAALKASLDAIPASAAKTAGVALGEDIANAILTIRANDGYLNYGSYTGSETLGTWRPTGPMYLVAQDPQWGSVTPFALTSGDEFRASAPPALDSATYAAALNEVQSVGSVNSTTRTADQTQQALFWADGGGSYTPPGHWVDIASQVALAKGQSLSANARLMAQLNVALADAAIACWDTKYTYDLWRPVTAIQNADQ
ncbi:MAG: hypothetical protein RI920_1226, partial [Pseudomonadota bacterium]